MNDEWHKALVLVMRKLGIVEILISQADMDQVQAIEEENQPAALVFQMEDGVHIKLGTVTQAREMAALSGSQPS